MKIIHSADWHFSYKRKDQIQAVTSQYFSQLESIREPFIQIIAGDVFDNKMNSSVDDFFMVKDFLNTCQKLSKTYIILGNHDFNIRNKTTGNMIQKMLTHFSMPNLHFLEKTGIYGVDVNHELFHSSPPINLYVFSIYDDMNGVEKLKGRNSVNIGLYHGLIKGAVFFNGHTKKNQGIDINFFNNRGLDILLMGDIHKRQVIPISPTVDAIYAGSPYQMHYGESIKNHGYVEIDVKSKDDIQYNFVDLHNEYNFVKVNYFNNQFNIINE